MTRVFAGALALLALAAPARADAPARVPVQGFVTDAAGLPVEGTHDVRFRLYPTASGGAALHDELAADVAIVEGLFSVELGAASALDLSLFETHDALFLGIAIDDDAELAPRIALGTVPWAAFANRAGDARTLGGLAPEDFRLAADPVAFDELVGVPADLADGDDDTLDGLTCTDGAIAVRAAGAWVCGFDGDTLGGLSCATGQVPKRAGSEWVCGDDIDTDTDTDTDTLGGLSCVAGDIAFFDGAAWTCLPLAGTACAAGDVVTGFDETGALLCEAPADATVRGQTCPANQFMRGINADGSLVCATLDSVIRTYVNANCFIYIGSDDQCENDCHTAVKAGRVNQTECDDTLGSNDDDNSCGTQSLGGFSIRTMGLNFDGDVDGNDKLFIGMRCF